MLSTLLFILKIICIVVLAILGLILSIVLLVMFVPVRYRFLCSYQEGICAQVKITWLLHLLSVLATYDQSLEISVKLLGFPLKGSKKGGEEEENQEEAFSEGRENREGDRSQEEYPEIEILEEDFSGERDNHSGQARTDEFLREPVLREPERKTKQAKRKKIKFRFQAFCDKVRAVEEKGKKIRAFLADPANQKSFRHILRIARHILPRKVSGSVEFGFEDPSVTGQAAALCSVAYARYGDSLQITPVFDEQILEAQVKGKGRIILGAVSVLCLRVLMNKNFRRFIFKRRRKKDGGE